MRGGWQWLRTAPDPATGRGRAELVCHCTPFRCTTQTKQAHHGGVGPERSDSRVVPCFCTTWLPFRVPPGLAEARFRCSNGGTSCAPSTQQPELLHSPRLLVLGLVTTKAGGWVDLEGWLAQVAHCTRPCSWPWAHSTSLWLRSFQVHNPDQAQQKCDTNACYRSLYQCQKNSWENSGCFVHSAEVLCAVRSPL